MSENGMKQYCEGCEGQDFDSDELQWFLMEYGGVETLCQECAGESHGITDELLCKACGERKSDHPAVNSRGAIKCQNAEVW